jgi:hypothetical protein
MNVSGHRKSKCPEGDGKGSVQSGLTRRVTQAKVLIAYMNRECDA